MINLKIITQENEFNLTQEENSSLKDIIKQENIALSFPCGGNGRCGRCKVTVKNGEAIPTDKEKKKLTEQELNDGVRLACCLNLQNDLEIEIDKKQKS